MTTSQIGGTPNARNSGSKFQERQVDVAIIGAGPAGLTAGYLLTKQGLSVAII